MKEYEIAGLLIVAKRQLVYSEFIARYPASAGKRDFDLVSPTDLFYRNVCSLSYHDGLLIIGSLVDKDKRVMSFWNWPDFVSIKTEALQKLTDEFNRSGLKDIRDQIVAHQDSSNGNNNFPDARRGGVRINLIDKTQQFLQKLIAEFYNYKKIKNLIYSPTNFDIGDVYNEVKSVMLFAKPTLTDNFII